ncbi:hypothetical protein AVEN_110181-1 [Araneus ventricosus]|uniref:Uncharacterized protein n=1 Tax=Araneus ventricosus TaxID=182803 RepID=A0A4Y2ERF4_ARAVE|nr:hypothetical protein AVEN_10597-1 [Araneus ventricosus]GBM31421.1 hypothetical protein AVEN_110181-1 [Araneus ventricosus]
MLPVLPSHEQKVHEGDRKNYGGIMTANRQKRKYRKCGESLADIPRLRTTFYIKMPKQRQDAFNGIVKGCQGKDFSIIISSISSCRLWKMVIKASGIPTSNSISILNVYNQMI